MNQQVIDFDALARAAKARDRGMDRAASHADRVAEGWSQDAYDYLVRYAQTHGQFISEDVSDASKADKALPQPPTDRAWGPVYVKAVKAGVIQRVGIGRSRRRHASICPLWESLVVMGKAA